MDLAGGDSSIENSSLRRRDDIDGACNTASFCECMGGDIDDLNSERQLILSARPLASPWTAAKFNDWYLIVTVWSTKILPGQRIFFLVFSVLPSAFRKPVVVMLSQTRRWVLTYSISK